MTRLLAPVLVAAVIGCGTAPGTDLEASERRAASERTAASGSASGSESGSRSESGSESGFGSEAVAGTEVAAGSETAAAAGSAEAPPATGNGSVAFVPCRVRSLLVEYDRESDTPGPPTRSEIVSERFVDDWSDRHACDRVFDDYAIRPMRCAPRARMRSEVRGDVLAPDRVLVHTRDGDESLDVTFDAHGRTRRIDWDPTASGSFDYAFVYEYDCAP